ncbi:hypothetical protein BLI708_05425 [Bifidobacterium imperatoris]|uniref:Uncharacterized protein n=1 Tax=Bifidobacterium imperatoris TaxID=2020965 RepID=A0A2N5ISX5_9BIFI|nr:hypothetical protein [Bifidobacterium imperatoris]PLS25063.1 hypothetical protein Tam1G_0919 [Bifidobacterium imperatoris]QSY58692.1 hypothetical protein BLI708_05425 [Bifidobacterium imperatoris]
MNNNRYNWKLRLLLTIMLIANLAAVVVLGRITGNYLVWLAFVVSAICAVLIVTDKSAW